MQQLDKWHKTTQGYLVFGLVELLVAYGLASWAIDNGGIWLYLLTFVMVYGAVRNLVMAVRKGVTHVHKGSQAKKA